MNPNSDKSKESHSAENPLPPTPQPATVEPVIAPVSPAKPAGSQGLAIATLVIGIIAFLTGFLGIGVLLGIIALALGAVALMKHQDGKVMTIIGMVLAGIAIVVGGFLFLLLVGISSVWRSSFEAELENQQEGRSQTQIQSDFPTE